MTYSSLQFEPCFSNVETYNLKKYFHTSRFWPRVRTRALRAPSFVSSLSRKTGRCAPPCPSQLRCFSFDPQKYMKSMELGPPTSKASLILPAIFWGQNYVLVPPYALIFFGFSFFIQFLELFFLILSYFSSLLFNVSY